MVKWILTLAKVGNTREEKWYYGMERWYFGEKRFVKAPFIRTLKKGLLCKRKVPIDQLVIGAKDICRSGYFCGSLLKLFKRISN